MQTSIMFEKEIGYITNKMIQKIVMETLDAAPECIQVIPASSSGKYHPSYSLGEGGLTRHIKAAVRIAHTIIETDTFQYMMGASDETLEMYKDAAYAALILHDCMKPDNTPKHNTVFNHPILAADLFKKIADRYVNQSNAIYLWQMIPMIYDSIGVVLPKPQRPLEYFVHLCDYLASKKFLLFDFDIYDGVEK